MDSHVNSAVLIRGTEVLNRLFFIPLMILLWSCSQVDNAPIKLFDVHSEIIDLSQEIGGDWEKICIFPPYTTNKYATEILGFDFDVESKSGIYVLDNITLLVTIKLGRVVEYFETPRSNIDFASLKAGCILKQGAKFRIVKDKKVELLQNSHINSLKNGVR